MPPGDAWLASPSGADAVRPRASIGLIVTLALIAALVGGAQLRHVVGAVQPQAAAEVDQRLLLGKRGSIFTAVCSAASWRSVLNTLNSPSPWPNDVPLSVTSEYAVAVEIVAVSASPPAFR